MLVAAQSVFGPAGTGATVPEIGSRPDAAADDNRVMTDAGPESSLEEMLRRAASGDAEAWRVLVERYTPRVYGLIRSQCGNTDLAEEITQSTFCTVAAKIGSYNELGRFEPWLFRIATNRLRDEMRRRKRHATSVEHDTLTGLAGSDADADRESSRPESAEIAALRDAMQQLSASDRHVIHLRHQAGLSFKQIAEVLEQPLGTVLAREHRARKRLQALLEHLETDPE